MGCVALTPLDARRGDLGEGAFWHPLRKEFMWFDITGRKLQLQSETHDFPQMVSAAGWVDADRLMIASESALLLFDLRDGSSQTITPLDAGNQATRSNDGRADPQGGFWISTMGKDAQRHAGAIWRWYRGELRPLYTGITIPNAICFAPDGRSACFTDTPTQQVMRVALDTQGWPQGVPECWIDLRGTGLNPDGAVIDAAGAIWIAQWGAGRVAAYGPDGTFRQSVPVPAAHVSCPAFGGPDLTTLYVTTAWQGLATPGLLDGAVFWQDNVGCGQAEHRVLFDDA